MMMNHSGHDENNHVDHHDYDGDNFWRLIMIKFMMMMMMMMMKASAPIDTPTWGDAIPAGGL